MNDPSTLAETAWVRFEEIIQRFEEAWRRGDRPDIDDFLSNHGSSDRRVLAELVHIDLEFRLRADEDVHVEEYLDRFPQLRADPATAIELIADEFALRHRWRSGAKPIDFLKRFPEFEKELAARLNAAETLGHSHRLSAFFGEPSDVPQLPGFTIQEEVGRGGMGIVYKALDLRLNRVVALKTLAGGNFAAATERERFRHEAEAIAHLDHPNIVPVYEVGEYQGLPFFSMKYFAGGSLAQHARGRNADLYQISEIVKIVAGAVHHAHQRGILHRDLKPSNILLDEESRPYVTDFGLAKRFDPRAGAFDASTIAGTPAYMAPEQAAGKGDLTTATDVYGLGAVLYELLTGAKPFSGDSPLTILQQLSDTPPTRPIIHNPKLPRDLETITLKCLEKNPQRRYRSASDLAEDLERWQTGESIHARPVSPWERTWRTLRRHPVVTGLIAATAMAVVFAIVTLTISRERIRVALTQEQQATAELSQVLEREREILYQERVSSAWRMWSSNHTERAEELLELCPPRFRRLEWFLIDRLRRQEKWDVGEGSSKIHTALYSPDGKNLAVGDNNGVVSLYDATEGSVIHTFAGDSGAVSRIAFHPGGEVIAAVIGKTVYAWNIVDGKRLFKLPATKWATFSPDGQTLAVGNGFSVDLIDVDKQTVRKKLSKHTNEVLCGGFNQAGQLATGGVDRTLRVWDCRTGEEVYPARTYAQSVYSLLWIPGVNRIALSQYFDLMVIDPATGQETERIAATEHGQMGLAISNDGNYLAYVVADGTIRIRDLKTDQEFQSLRGHQPPIQSLSFHPTGTRLASVGSIGRARIWKIGEQSEGRLLVPLNSITGLSFSADGKSLAAARFFVQSGPDNEQNKIKIVNVVTGETKLSLPGNRDAAFGPNGKWVATSRADGSISAFDVATGGELWNQVVPGQMCGRLAISQTGRLAAATNTGDVLIWDKPGQSEPRSLHQHTMPIYSLSFSADGNLLATGSRDGELILWDRAGEIYRRLHYGNSIMTVAVSPDGRLVAASGAGRMIRIWNVADGSELIPCHGHINQVLSIAFSPDGRRLVSGGIDTNVYLWDVASGREIMNLPGSRGVVNSVAFSPDGRRIAVAAQALKVWEIAEDAQLPHCP